MAGLLGQTGTGGPALRSPTGAGVEGAETGTLRGLLLGGQLRHGQQIEAARLSAARGSCERTGAAMSAENPLGISVPPAARPGALTVHLETQPVREGGDTGVDSWFAPLAAAITPRGDAVEDKVVRSGVLTCQRPP